MKKYVVYDWRADDEGGTGIYLANEWSTMVGYCPESGWRARPSVKIGEFDTVEELAKILSDRNEHPLHRYEFSEWLRVAQEMFDDYKEGMR